MALNSKPLHAKHPNHLPSPSASTLRLRQVLAAPEEDLPDLLRGFPKSYNVTNFYFSSERGEGQKGLVWAFVVGVPVSKTSPQALKMLRVFLGGAILSITIPNLSLLVSFIWAPNA